MKRLLMCSALFYVLPVFAGDLPDPRLTPGAVDARITQNNIDQTVCRRGYTKAVRPPAYYTNSLKREQIFQYGYTDRNPRHYEEDHLIPLNIGGNPVDQRNLWPEPRNTYWNADRKNELEFRLYQLVCTHQVTLHTAQQAFASDWIKAYKLYVGQDTSHFR